MIKPDSYTNKYNAWIDISSKKPPVTVVEQPIIQSLIADRQYKNILCIGSGTGKECNNFINKGCKKVIGLEPSPGLVDYAKEHYPGAEYVCETMEKMDFQSNHFDLIYASMSLHYTDRLDEVFEKVSNYLRAGGDFVFSINHPIFRDQRLASGKPKGYQDFRNRISKAYKSVFGFKKKYAGIRVYENYIYKNFKVRQYAYKLSDYINMLVENDLKVVRLEEPILKKPTNDKYFNSIYENEPAVLVVKATK